ncbi:MAG: CocE/NonD family hydrolase, partial [Steroidobacter sp.]|nr:CocE/NonD family hydrolase [Steroidobacter sp.]
MMGWVLCLLWIVLSLGVARADEPSRAANPEDDFVMVESMIPMRDGVKLHTVVVSPKVIAKPMPMLLMRTPYGASGNVSERQVRLSSALGSRYAELDGYIFVFQDVRGRNGSEGTYELFRPLRGPFNATQTDQTTDAWDSIDWLIRNVPNSNGKVGMFGTSYDGWLVLAALLEPHPALQVAVPMNPMVDLWKGDDAFHNGAFRLGYQLDYLYLMDSKPGSLPILPRDHFDLYNWWLKQGSARDLQARYLPKSAMFARMLDRPAYDEFWQDAAIDRRLARSNARLVPTLHVHSWFDQEDPYGAPAAYAAMEERDRHNDSNFFTAGPWSHGENWSRGARIGQLDWDQATGPRWRAEVLAPFLARHLKDGPPHGLANAVVFNTGSSRWDRLDAWPLAPGAKSRSLYMSDDGRVSWDPGAAGRDTYISDPRRPVPYQPRPIKSYYGDDTWRSEWSAWLLADQRFVDGRPDVLSFVSEPLAEPLTVRGNVTARLFAETTGTDADWVVKLIDVFPDQDPFNAQMSGYQLMISGEIFRGRYRESFSKPQAIAANRVLEYLIRQPQVNHTFRRGHRVMVQIQSSWFPLYDRNPQVFL